MFKNVPNKRYTKPRNNKIKTTGSVKSHLVRFYCDYFKKFTNWEFLNSGLIKLRDMVPKDGL